ncbi:MAG TPA: flagellar biosynthesis protein FlgF, partial [Agrobacterium sp.]|nr:flagellar biosynthesis protein FlgF [Agrobacterium sp.]
MTSTYTSYRLISQDIGKSLERVSKQPDVARETEYYRAKIGDVKSIDDFMVDTRLYNYALKAHGL